MFWQFISFFTLSLFMKFTIQTFVIVMTIELISLIYSVKTKVTSWSLGYYHVQLLQTITMYSVFMSETVNFI